MSSRIPNSVIGSVAPIIAEHYFNHSTLNSLFMGAGAPGEVPAGNCEKKCCDWLKRCNDDLTVDALGVLGLVIQNYMDQEPLSSFLGEGAVKKMSDGKAKINNALAKNQLLYRTNGYITLAGSTPISKTLEEYLKSGDFSSIEKEFDRAIVHINSDPHASITAACAIIESTLKCYIEVFDLEMPSKLNVMPLWGGSSAQSYA